MAGQLKTASIAAPGFLGLNSQESEVTLESGYATSAYNCVIDKYGRLGSRRGWTFLTTNKGTLTTGASLDALYYLTEVDGSIQYLSAGDNKLFTGLTTLVAKSIYGTDVSGVPLVTQPTYTTSRWQFASLQEGIGSAALTNAFAAQSGAEMLVYRKLNFTGSYVFQKIGTTGYGTVPTGVSFFDPDSIHSAYGRVWVSGVSGNKSTVYYSRLLKGSEFSGVGSGLLDVGSVVGNNDEVISISSYNNFLIVFCRNSIVVYANADDPTKLTLLDVINGVGCIARDSIQQTGTDLIFLSNSGVRSLSRTIQEKSMPMRDLSSNIRDELVAIIQSEIPNNIKSIYYERDAIYLLSFPSIKQIICFDTRSNLQNGASRITIWEGITYKALCTTTDRKLLLGVADGIAQYNGYTDNGKSYRMVYFTSNTDFGIPTTVKFLKKARIVIIGTETQDFVIKYGFDYSASYTPRIVLRSSSRPVSEYNKAEYGIGEYSGGLYINEINVNLGGSGKVAKFGIEATINGAPVSIQKADLYIKTGRVL